MCCKKDAYVESFLTNNIGNYLGPNSNYQVPSISWPVGLSATSNPNEPKTPQPLNPKPLFRNTNPKP